MSVEGVTPKPVYLEDRQQLCTDFLKKKSLKQIDLNATDSCSFGFLQFLLRVLQVATPMIMFVASSLPYFANSITWLPANISWLPFAGVGVILLLLLVQIYIKNKAMSKMSKEEAFQTLHGMLGDERPRSFVPITNADLSKEEKWRSDSLTPTLQSEYEKMHERISPLQTARFTGFGGSQEDPSQPVYDLQGVAALKSLIAGGVAGLHDATGIDSLKQLLHKSRFLQYKALIPAQKEIKTYVYSQLYGGGHPKSEKAKEKYEQYLVKNNCTEEERASLDALDIIQFMKGEGSQDYLESEEIFLTNDNKDGPVIERHARLNSVRYASLQSRNPLYGLEISYSQNVAGFRQHAFRGTNPALHSVAQNKSEKIPSPDPIKQASSLVFEQHLLFEKLDRAYAEWKEIEPFLEERDSFSPYIEKLKNYYRDLFKPELDHVGDISTFKKFKKAVANLLHDSKSFLEFTKKNPALERKLLYLHVATEEAAAHIINATQTDTSVRLKKAGRILSACRKKIGAKEKALKEDKGTSKKEWNKAVAERRRAQKLEHRLGEIRLKLEKFKAKGDWTPQDKEEIVLSKKELADFIAEKIQPFANSLDARNEITLAQAFKKFALEDFPADFKKAFWPKQKEIAPPDPEELKKDPYPVAFKKWKQYLIKQEHAKVDQRLIVLNLIHEIALGAVANLILLTLTGVFFYWYPNTVALSVVVGIDWLAAASRLGMEFWMSHEDQRKREFKKQLLILDSPEDRLKAAPSKEFKALLRLADSLNIDCIESVEPTMRSLPKAKSNHQVFSSLNQEQLDLDNLRLLAHLRRNRIVESGGNDKETLLSWFAKEKTLIFKHVHSIDEFIEEEEHALEGFAKEKDKFVERSKKAKLAIYNTILASDVSPGDPSMQALFTAITKPNTKAYLDYLKSFIPDDYGKDFTRATQFEDQDCAKTLQSLKGNISLNPFALRELRAAAALIPEGHENRLLVKQKIERIESNEPDKLASHFLKMCGQYLYILSLKALKKRLFELESEAAKRVRQLEALEGDEVQVQEGFAVFTPTRKTMVVGEE